MIPLGIYELIRLQSGEIIAKRQHRGKKANQESMAMG